MVGGHSEVTQGIDRPIIMGTMLGEVAPDKLIRTGGAQEGDSLVITKGIAIEGTAILAKERSQDLLRAGVAADTIERDTTFLMNPSISVLKDAAIACGADGLLLEVHPHPEQALTDGSQTLSITQFQTLMEDVQRVAVAVGRG